MMPEQHIVSVIAVSGFADVVLPQCFAHVTVAADRDPNNTATAQAIERAKHMISESGRNGLITFPPPPHDDWNSMLNHFARGGT
jgi:hypothetical protein